MPFPFFWAGALVAAVFLSIVLTLFGVLLKLTNRTATEVRQSILPGLVSGIRDWADEHGLPGITISSPRAGDDGPRLDDTPPSADLRLEHVHRAR